MITDRRGGDDPKQPAHYFINGSPAARNSGGKGENRIKKCKTSAGYADRPVWGLAYVGDQSAEEKPTQEF
jgi:hypothetical protein